MSNNSQIETVRSLYASGSYNDAFDTCISLLENKDKLEKSVLREATLTAALSYMNMLDAPPDDEKLNTICSTISTACSYSDSIDDLLQIEEIVFTEFDSWHEKSIKTQLRKLENDPGFDSWKAYFPIIPEYIRFKILLQIATRNNSAVDQYCEKEGIEKKDYAKLCEKHEDKFTDEDINSLEYETALRIFSFAKKELVEYADISAGYATEIYKRIIEHLTVTELMISHTIMREGQPPEIVAERLKSRAEAITLLLYAVVSPNGQPMSLLQSNRQENINKLREIYAKIKEIEPDFVEPEMPSAAPVGGSSATGGSGSGGGCYVATAVYGSYDCPQVWTLRRYRDDTLAGTMCGRLFIRIYYAVSPTIVKLFGDSAWFRSICKQKLDAMVYKLNKEGVPDTPYIDRKW